MKTKAAEFIVNRTGKIVLDQSGINQCKDIGHIEFSYHVAIYCPSPVLNSRGFVIDHFLIHQASKTVKQAESCERLCEMFHDALKEMFESEHISPRKVYLKIVPLPEAAAFTEYVITY